MKKNNYLIACLVLFFACIFKSNADTEFRWVKIFDYEAYGPEDLVEYNDETVFNLLNALSLYQTDSIYSLNTGETYRLRVTYDYEVDSCYATYDYVPTSYEVDGFWTYANYANLVSPDEFYGFYNIELDLPLSYDPDDYPDADSDFFDWLDVVNGPHFRICLTGLSYIKIEILAWREVEI